jgi:hypothetical protein
MSTFVCIKVINIEVFFGTQNQPEPSVSIEFAFRLLELEDVSCTGLRLLERTTRFHPGDLRERCKSQPTLI